MAARTNTMGATGRKMASLSNFDRINKRHGWQRIGMDGWHDGKVDATR
jgi:hypothetical protein